MTEDELLKFKEMVHKGKSDICWYVHRSQVKELIALAEELFELKTGHEDEK